MPHVTILTNVTKCGNNFRINNTGIETKSLENLYFVYKFFRGGNIMKKKNKDNKKIKKKLLFVLGACMVTTLCGTLAYFTTTSNAGYEGDFECATIPDCFRVFIEISLLKSIQKHIADSP